MITKTYITSLESVQNQVARLQNLHLRSADMLLLGSERYNLHRVNSRCIMFTWKVMNGKNCVLLKMLDTVLRDWNDPRTLQALNICGPHGLGLMDNHLGFVQKKLEEQAIAGVMSLMREQTLLKYSPQLDRWFKLQNNVSNSSLCGVLSKFQAGDVGLGNRRPNITGKLYKTCPLY